MLIWMSAVYGRRYGTSSTGVPSWPTMEADIKKLEARPPRFEVEIRRVKSLHMGLAEAPPKGVSGLVATFQTTTD